MSFKIGDKVRIKDEEFLINHYATYCLVDEMLKYHDKECTIVDIAAPWHSFNTYRLDIDRRNSFWCEDTLMRLTVNNNKEISEIVNAEI